MLVLTFRKNERICFGETIKVTELEIRGNIVHLGIECPREISVHRKEVQQRNLHTEQMHATCKPSLVCEMPV